MSHYESYRDPSAHPAPATDDFLRAHLPLAEMLARRFSRSRREVDELTQVAMIGLWKAARRFDPGRGVSFNTFAWRTITGELKRHKRDKTWTIRPPRSSHDNFLAVSGCVEDLTHELGRSPTVAELAARSGLPDEAVVHAMEVLRRGIPESLEGSHEPTGEPLGQLAVEDPGFERAASRTELGRLLDVLTERERRVVVLRFFGDLTQSEIGARLGCSQMHISRTLAAALAKLRTAARTAPGMMAVSV